MRCCALAALLLALLTATVTAQSDLQYFTACPAPRGTSGDGVSCNPAPLQLRVGQTPTFATQRGDTYNASMHYALVVEPPPGRQVIATITAFATEQGYDFFHALSAANLSLLPSGNATGLSGVDTLPLPYTILGNFGSRLALALTTDSSTESTGVRLTLSVVAPCTGDAPLALPGTQKCYGASACPAGTYASLATGSCELCPAGTASAAVGAASAAVCRPCKELAQAVQAGSTTCPVFFTSCPAPGVCLGSPLVLIPSDTSPPTLAVTQASASYSPAASYFLTVVPPPGYSVRVRLVAFDTAPTDFLVATTGTAGPFTLAGLTAAEPIFKDSGALLEESTATTFDGYFNSTVTLQLLAESPFSGGGSGVTLALSALPLPCAPPSFLVTVGSKTGCESSCPEGTYVSGAFTCGICPLGKYASAPTSNTPSSAEAACKPCPNGTTSAPGAADYGTPASGACLAVLGAASAGLKPALALPVPLPPLRFTTQAGPMYNAGGSYALALLPPPGFYVRITLSVDLSSAEFVIPGDSFAVLAGNVAGNVSAFSASLAALALPAAVAISTPTQYSGPFETPVTLLLQSASTFAQGKGVQGSIELLPQSCSGAMPLGVIGTSYCVAACPVGAWQSSPSACTQCPANFYGTEQGASSAVCSQCRPGTTSPPGAKAASDCTPCPLQHFRAPGQAACSACPAGSIAASTGAHTCVECPSGEGNVTDAAGVPTCAPCALGSYRNASMAVCTACPPGSIGDPSASPAACALCPSGTYSVNALQCLPCAPGTHAPVPGSAQCVPCSAAACGSAYQVAVRTLAGGRSGFRNGNGRAARFNSPLDVEVDSGSGTVFVSDT
jgi:hypothetical protein